MAERRESIDLEAFLAVLPDAEAAAARAAAARIDALEKSIGPPGWIERNLIPLAVIALALFVLGVAGLLGSFDWGRAAFGLGGVTLMVSVFPILVVAYLWSVRGRTEVDQEKMDLNDRHFLPHGGLYFGASDGDGKVLQVYRPEPDEPDLRQRTHRLYQTATKRRWWW